MNRGDIHACWAPLGATWTPWVKPVLFAQLDEEPLTSAPGPLPTWVHAEVVAPLERQPLDASSAPHPYRSSRSLDDVAVVVDLPGADGALVGVALARHGFRPVPLYNALSGPSPLLDVRPIMAVLVSAAADLTGLSNADLDHAAIALLADNKSVARL